MRKPVHHPVPANFGGRRQPKGRIAGYVWKEASVGRWRFETAAEQGGYETYRSEREAAAACLIADVTQRLDRDANLTISYLSAERDKARDAAKAQADLGICLDVVCEYRGPCGERYKVELVSAAAVAA
jgi:hypothetical protein